MRIGARTPMLECLLAGRVWLRNTTAWAGSILELVAACVLAVFGVAIGGCKLRTLAGIVVFARSGVALDYKCRLNGAPWELTRLGELIRRLVRLSQRRVHFVATLAISQS